MTSPMGMSSILDSGIYGIIYKYMASTFLLILLFFNFEISYAGDHISGMTLSHCGPNACYQIQSENGYQNSFDRGFTSFEVGTLTIKKTNGSQRNFHFESGNMDLTADSLVLRGLKNSIPTDLLIDLRTSQIQYF